MIQPARTHHESVPDTCHDTYSKTVFGFWVYILTDFVLFGVLFATYAVLRKNNFAGPNEADLFHPAYSLIQTLILLVSTFFIGMGGASAHRKNKPATITFYLLTFFLGVAFMWMELAEFSRFIEMEASWKRSAFLSAFFTLVGTHGIHMFFGLVWIIILLILLCMRGFSHTSLQRLTCMRIFWQFLNIVWIFIFTFVYLMGVKI